MVVDVSCLLVYASGEKRLEELATVINAAERLQEKKQWTPPLPRYVALALQRKVDQGPWRPSQVEFAQDRFQGT
jgi:hypothetical protein